MPLESIKYKGKWCFPGSGLHVSLTVYSRPTWVLSPHFCLLGISPALLYIFMSPPLTLLPHVEGRPCKKLSKETRSPQQFVWPPRVCNWEELSPRCGGIGRWWELLGLLGHGFQKGLRWFSWDPGLVPVKMSCQKSKHDL